MTDKQLFVVTVSPQSVSSIAVKRQISASDAARLIATYFFSKGKAHFFPEPFALQFVES